MLHHLHAVQDGDASHGLLVVFHYDFARQSSHVEVDNESVAVGQFHSVLEEEVAVVVSLFGFGAVQSQPGIIFKYQYASPVGRSEDILVVGTLTIELEVDVTGIDLLAHYQ